MNQIVALSVARKIEKGVRNHFRLVRAHVAIVESLEGFPVCVLSCERDL
jgi:hypothetical protein